MNNTHVYRLIVLVIIAAGIFYGLTRYYDSLKPIISTSPEPVACTMEAKQCPDGSYVSRGGLQCEFATCPPVSTTPGWKTSTTTTGIRFQYPENLGTQFITPQAWPPTISTKTGTTLTCVQTQGNGAGGVGVEKVTVNGREYCVQTSSEGAAGSIYIHSVYNTIHAGQEVSVDMTLQYPQCVNYDDPNKTNCQKAQKDLNVDNLVDQMVETMVFTQ